MRSRGQQIPDPPQQLDGLVSGILVYRIFKSVQQFQRPRVLRLILFPLRLAHNFADRPAHDVRRDSAAIRHLGRLAPYLCYLCGLQARQCSHLGLVFHRDTNWCQHVRHARRADHPIGVRLGIAPALPAVFIEGAEFLPVKPLIADGQQGTPRFKHPVEAVLDHRLAPFQFCFLLLIQLFPHGLDVNVFFVVCGRNQFCQLAIC